MSDVVFDIGNALVEDERAITNVNYVLAKCEIVLLSVYRQRKLESQRLCEKQKAACDLHDASTLCLLHHYKACEYEVLRRRDDAGAPTLRAWIKTVRAHTCYIVHLKTHALFVEVGAVRSKWSIYDQSGVHIKQHTAFLERIGGYSLQLVVAIVQITYAGEAEKTDTAPDKTGAETDTAQVLPAEDARARLAVAAHNGEPVALHACVRESVGAAQTGAN